MSVAEVFFDTNVLLYLVPADLAKADIAETTIAGGGHLSVQVLNEFVSVARRKAGLDWREIDEVLGSVRQMCRVHSLTVDDTRCGAWPAQKYDLGFYEASIVASALPAAVRRAQRGYADASASTRRYRCRTRTESAGSLQGATAAPKTDLELAAWGRY